MLSRIAGVMGTVCLGVVAAASLGGCMADRAGGPALVPTAARPAARLEVRREGGRVWVAGVDRYRVREPMFEAVRHAHSTKNVDKLGGKDWVGLEGLACYDRWARDFEDPAKKRGSGDSYCYGIYRSTHRAAAGFLREIAPRYPEAVAAHLRAAADRFADEAGILDGGTALLGWKSPEADAARNAAAVTLLRQARAAYAAGIAEIEQALAALGPAGP